MGLLSWGNSRWKNGRSSWLLGGGYLGYGFLYRVILVQSVLLIGFSMGLAVGVLAPLALPSKLS
jgi:hypothetical protein